MMKKILIALLLSVVCNHYAAGQIGTWRNYMAYHDVQQIVRGGDNLYVKASNNLYQYNLNDQSITTYDKVNGLNDINISRIAWNASAKRLIVVYENSNIDLLEENGNIINIASLYNKTIINGEKTVRSVRIDGVYAYLVCDFGIVKINMQRAEIADTYTPNNPEYPTSLPDEPQNDYDKYIDLVKTLNPGGPKYNNFYEMRYGSNGRLYTSGGMYSSYNDLNYPGAVQVLNQDKSWQIYQDELDKITGYSYTDIDCVDYDPRDPDHVFASGRTGLYEFQNGSLVAYYNKDNSPLQPATAGNGSILDNNYLIIKAIKFDSDGNLWIMNNHSKTTSLLKLTNNKEWVDLDNSNLYYNNTGVSMHGMRNMFIDSRGLLWMVNEDWRNPCVVCLDTENSERLTVYNEFVNQDGIVYNLNPPHCVVEDIEGNIWIGSSEGPFYLNKNDIGNSNATFYQVKIPRNDGSNYADYLLSGVEVTSIAIDAGGRKWMGTKNNGVYLISSDNMSEVYHFTANESFLLSDVVYCVTIDNKSGEVYFATENGLCSYVSDATYTNDEMTKDNVYAYPNPVTPDYTGLITVVGLTLNAYVKILSPSGELIAEGRSNGGMFTWDGRDKKGRGVAPGIYMVATATSDGKKGAVCKIAVIK